MEKSKFGLIISVVFFLIFVELAILYLKDEVCMHAEIRKLEKLLKKIVKR